METYTSEAQYDEHSGHFSLSFKYDFIQFCVDNTEVFQP